MKRLLYRGLAWLALLGVALFVAILAGCGTGAGSGPSAPTVVPATAVVEPNPASLDQPFTLKIGESTAVEAADLTIKFSTVLNDSRCPAKVNCAWIGQASVSVVLQKPGQPDANRTLATIASPEKTDRLSYAGYEIRLVGLTPLRDYPDQRIEPEAYVVELVVAQQP